MDAQTSLNKIPHYEKQLKAFEKYANEFKVKRLAEKMLIDSLVSQLAEAKANSLPAIDIFEMKQQVNELHTIVTKKPLPVEKVLSSKEKMKKEIEEMLEETRVNALLQKS